RRPRRDTNCPLLHYTTLFRAMEEWDKSSIVAVLGDLLKERQGLVGREGPEVLDLEEVEERPVAVGHVCGEPLSGGQSGGNRVLLDRKGTRLNSSHQTSYAGFC